MNRFFDDLGQRWAAAAGRRGVEIAPPSLDPDLAAELLELARIAAHTQERRFAPLVSYLAGVAAERLRAAKPEMNDAAITAFVHEVRDELERETPASG